LVKLGEAVNQAANVVPFMKAPNESDDLLRLEGARILTAAGDRRGLEVAVAFLSSDAPLLYRDEAGALLREQTGKDFGYDPFATVEENAEAIKSWHEWLN
jgi:hypothetical protein